LSGPAFCGKAARDWARRCSAFSRFQAWRKWRTDFSSAGAAVRGGRRPADRPGTAGAAVAAAAAADGGPAGPAGRQPPAWAVRTAAAARGRRRAARGRLLQPLGQQGLGPRGLGRQAPGQGLQVGKAHRVGLVQARRPQRRQLGLGRPGSAMAGGGLGRLGSADAAPLPRRPRHRRHLHPAVAGPALGIGVGGHRLLRAEGGGKDMAAGTPPRSAPA
jgi:hypothetical protein